MDDFLTAHQALVNWAKKDPDREFLFQPVDGSVRIHTFRQAEDATRRMASALLGLGLEPGDKVGILAKNSAEWFLADMAIAAAGLISVPIYPTASADTISYIIGHSESRAVFVGKLDDPDVARAIPGNITRIAFPYGIEGCEHDWQALIDSNEPLENLHEPDTADTMSILYTSGSTGKPKGVALSYRAYHYGSMASVRTIDVNSGDRLFSYLWRVSLCPQDLRYQETMSVNTIYIIFYNRGKKNLNPSLIG